MLPLFLSSALAGPCGDDLNCVRTTLQLLAEQEAALGSCQALEASPDCVAWKSSLAVLTQQLNLEIELAAKLAEEEAAKLAAEAAERAKPRLGPHWVTFTEDAPKIGASCSMGEPGIVEGPSTAMALCDKGRIVLLLEWPERTTLPKGWTPLSPPLKDPITSKLFGVWVSPAPVRVRLIKESMCWCPPDDTGTFVVTADPAALSADAVRLFMDEVQYGFTIPPGLDLGKAASWGKITPLWTEVETFDLPREE